MTDLNEIAVFVSVAQLGSFTGAARALSMPVATVSRRIADLEQELGVTLIQRTTRKLTLTAQGRDYFDQCSEPLAHLYDAERVLTHSQRQPEGILRISVPVILGDPVFLGFLSDFLRNHPRIRLDLFITNQMLDLVAESIDVALRIGELKSSSIVARKLGTTVRYVVAAPAYLAGRARPREPAELAGHGVRAVECPQQRGRVGAGKWPPPCACACGRSDRQPRFPVGQLLRRSRTRNRSLAVDVLRLADREWHAGAPPAKVELGAGVGSRRVSHAQVPAGEDQSLPAIAARLAKPILGLGLGRRPKLSLQKASEVI